MFCGRLRRLDETHAAKATSARTGAHNGNCRRLCRARRGGACAGVSVRWPLIDYFSGRGDIFEEPGPATLGSAANPNSCARSWHMA